MPAAVLKPVPWAEETALPAWFCLEIQLRENTMIGRILVEKRNALPSVICVTKLLDVSSVICVTFLVHPH